jgi:hypothetical protein
MEIEKLTFGPTELARELGYELKTIKRLMTQLPGRLPPAVLLGENGKRGKRLWLRATVASWLKDRETAAIPIKELARKVQVPVDTTQFKRGPGRPRKLALTGQQGGA